MAKKNPAPEELKNKQKGLRQRHKYANVVNLISSNAITALDLNNFIESSVKILGSLPHVSNVYIYQFVHGYNQFFCSHEWRKKGVPAQKGGELDAVNFPWFMEKMKNNKTISSKDIEKYAPINEKGFLNKQKANSLQIIPMNLSTEFYGFIGIASSRRGYFLDKDEIWLLQTISRIITQTIERKNYEGLVRLRIVEKDKLGKVENELDVALKQLLQTARLVELGTFGISIIHELNSPILAINGFTKLILNTKNLDPLIKSYAEKINIAGRQVLQIVKNVRGFAASEAQPDLKKSKINDIINNSIDLTRNHFTLSGKQLVCMLDKYLPDIMVDPVQICQVFINIITNAISSMKQVEKGRLTIITELSDDKKSVIIEFIDQGKGISKEDISKIFQPFFSSWDKGGGIGLGLALCMDIIQSHGGDILVSSSLGKGATFKVKLPIRRGNS